VSQPFPERAAYALEPGHPEKPASAGTLAVRVMPLRIAKPYDSQLFNYKVGPSQFTQDYYSGFIAPPDRLLGAQLVDWLNDSGAVKYAVPPGSSLDCDANLETQVSALYADHTKNTAVIEMRALLVSDAVGPTRVLLQKTYSETEPLANQSPGALVAAWNKAYRRLLENLAANLHDLSPPKK